MVEPDQEHNDDIIIVADQDDTSAAESSSLTAPQVSFPKIRPFFWLHIVLSHLRHGDDFKLLFVCGEVNVKALKCQISERSGVLPELQQLHLRSNGKLTPVEGQRLRFHNCDAVVVSKGIACSFATRI